MLKCQRKEDFGGDRILKLPKSWKNCEVLQVVATVAAVNQKRQQKTGGKWDKQHKHKQCKKQTNKQSGMNNTKIIIITQTKKKQRNGQTTGI